jgi:hypothetical protein
VGTKSHQGMDFWIQPHPTPATGNLIAPLTAADATTANVPDNQMHVSLTSSSSLAFSLLPSLRYTAADPGHGDRKLCEHSKRILGIGVVRPLERHESTFKKRLELACFCKSAVVQSIYNQRGIHIELLIEHIKSVLG